MIKLDLNAIEARCKAATEGPWIRHNPDSRGQDAIGRAADLVDDGCGGAYLEHEIITCDSGVYGPRSADAEFICHARTDIPALVARVRELEKALNAAADMCESNAALSDEDYDRGCDWVDACNDCAEKIRSRLLDKEPSRG